MKVPEFARATERSKASLDWVEHRRHRRSLERPAFDTQTYRRLRLQRERIARERSAGTKTQTRALATCRMHNKDRARRENAECQLGPAQRSGSGRPRVAFS